MKLTVEHVADLRFQVQAGEHADEKHPIVNVDAALEDGGTGAAPSAPQLFAAAVGACVLEFVVNSCRLREISFERLSLEIEFEEMERPRRIGVLEATIYIEPDLPEDVKRRLIGVARHATLANTLARPPELAVKFA